MNFVISIDDKKSLELYSKVYGLLRDIEGVEIKRPEDCAEIIIPDEYLSDQIDNYMIINFGSDASFYSLNNASQKALIDEVKDALNSYLDTDECIFNAIDAVFAQRRELDKEWREEAEYNRKHPPMPYNEDFDYVRNYCG